jgi:hypothetical protein
VSRERRETPGGIRPKTTGKTTKNSGENSDPASF